ncbi:Molecular chaperone Hsp40/DnaJ family protein [Trifolium repens]|nr:Molecular chaperone Hsp40/DnaJ family protein [Trifolium repens]
MTKRGLCMINTERQELRVQWALGSSAYATNPFDLFERFFGPSMGGFAGMDPTGFGTRRRSTVTKGEDIR